MDMATFQFQGRAQIMKTSGSLHFPPGVWTTRARSTFPVIHSVRTDPTVHNAACP